MRNHVVLRVISKLYLPFILLFALYVQFHGDYGPGGGFQAGVIFAAAFILYTLIYGLERVRQALPPGVALGLAAVGLLIYAGTGVMALLLGGNFLGYGVLEQDPVSGQHLGIFLVELGVGIAVFAAMVSVFFAFVGRSR